MPAVTGVQDTTDNTPVINKSNPIGNWEIHSWGDGAAPGMAAVSAITTLQVGATLASTSEDKIAMNEAAEYLKKALASQLKSFQHEPSVPRPNLQRTLF